MPDFGQRSNETELMDRDDISFEEFHHCLQGLETINVLTLAYRPTLQWIRTWIKAEQSLVILDAGSGGGDMLRRVAKLSQRMGRHGAEQNAVKPTDTSRRANAGGHTSGTAPSTTLIGVDLNPWSKKSAELSTPLAGRSDFLYPGEASIQYVTDDIFDFNPDQPIDIIICSLFTHHLSDEQIVDFLRWLDSRARQGWFINDLHRHPLPYYFIKFATRLFSRNRLIRHDAAVSVARAFTAKDWNRLLREAGIADRARVQWFFPFRICVASKRRA